MLIDGTVASKKELAHYASKTNRNVCLKINGKYGKISKSGPRLPHKENKGKKLTPFP